MTEDKGLILSIFDGWHAYQEVMTETKAWLTLDQLALRAAAHMRSVGEIAAHIIGARARWFYLLIGEGGDEFEAFGRWDRRGEKARNAEEIVRGLEATWIGMHDAIDRWSQEDWDRTWPGESDSEPEVISRQWVIWHLIEHDVFQGGEISITLGARGVPAVEL